MYKFELIYKHIEYFTLTIYVHMHLYDIQNNVLNKKSKNITHLLNISRSKHCVTLTQVKVIVLYLYFSLKNAVLSTQNRLGRTSAVVCDSGANAK